MIVLTKNNSVAKYTNRAHDVIVGMAKSFDLGATISKNRLPAYCEDDSMAIMKGWQQVGDAFKVVIGEYENAR